MHAPPMFQKGNARIEALELMTVHNVKVDCLYCIYQRAVNKLNV